MRILEEYADHKPALVFCNTRKSAMQASQHLAKEAASMGRNPFVFSADHQRVLNALAQRTKDRALADVCRSGLAFHHGGMMPEDRRLVETAFLEGHIAVLCRAQSPAVARRRAPHLRAITWHSDACDVLQARPPRLQLGYLRHPRAVARVPLYHSYQCFLAVIDGRVQVNLPAHLVVIKSTQQYTDTGYSEYSELDILQMIGRAGRPQVRIHAPALRWMTLNLISLRPSASGGYSLTLLALRSFSPRKTSGKTTKRSQQAPGLSRAGKRGIVPCDVFTITFLTC